MNRQRDPKTPPSEDSVPEDSRVRGRRNRAILLVAALLCLGTALAIYILRLDSTVGMFADDAWYVLLAKAIATGHGFTMINSPTPGIQPFYPPGFPALLSIVFRFAPEFPQNLWLLKSVSIAAMMAVGFFTYWYFKSGRSLPAHLALAIAMATTITPPLVFLSTSTVMSEPVFVLLCMLTVALIEQGVRNTDRQRLWRWVIPASILASFAFLTRSIAIALIGSVVLYLLKERYLRGAILFAVGVVICVGPWMVYSRQHAPTAEMRAEQSGYIVHDYTTAFWLRKAGNPRSGVMGASDLPERVWENATQMFTRDAGEMVIAKLFYLLRDSGAGEKALSFVFALLIIAGYISAVREKVTLAEIMVPATIAIVLLWPWETFRFLIPLTPFAIYYLLLGLRSIFHLHLRLREQPRKPEWRGLTVLATFIIVLHLYGNIAYIMIKRTTVQTERPGLMRAFEENEDVLRWINERLAEGVIATSNPALVHLFTGRSTVASDDPQTNWPTWNRIGVRYLAYLSALPVSDPDLSEARYKVLYKPRGQLNLRVVDLGPPETRQSWGAVLPGRMMN